MDLRLDEFVPLGSFLLPQNAAVRLGAIYGY